jgi:conjugal transfer pilus assembly protein TraE
MKFDFLKRNLDASRATIAFQSILLIASVVVNILMVIALLKTVGNERTIIVPPNIQKSFWVDNEKVSGSYLEQMGTYIAYLVLNATPTTVDYQNNILMQYVAPAYYGQFDTDAKASAERLKRDNIAQVFLPNRVLIDEPNSRVGITGTTSTYVNNAKVSDVRKGYLVEFIYREGKIYLKSFKEADANDPFKPVKKAAGTASN